MISVKKCNSDLIRQKWKVCSLNYILTNIYCDMIEKIIMCKKFWAIVVGTDSFNLFDEEFSTQILKLQRIHPQCHKQQSSEEPMRNSYNFCETGSEIKNAKLMIRHKQHMSNSNYVDKNLCSIPRVLHCISSEKSSLLSANHHHFRLLML